MRRSRASGGIFGSVKNGDKVTAWLAGCLFFLPNYSHAISFQTECTAACCGCANQGNEIG